MVKLDITQLKQVKLRDYAIRFLFGGTVSVLAALIALWAGGQIGGIFTTFPAILLASLTIIGKYAGRHPAVEEAQGAVLGAIALVIASFVLSVTLKPFAGIWSLLLALASWLVCGVGLYLLSVKFGWLRPEKPREKEDRARSQEPPG